MAAQMFGNAGREHMEKYGTRPEHFAKIALKNHKHSVNNPFVPEDKGKGEGNNNRCVAVRLLHPSSHLVLVFALGQALAIPRRIHTRADYGLLQGARTADQAAVLPDVSSVVGFQLLLHLHCNLTVYPLCSQTSSSDGGAAAILCSEDFVRKHKLQGGWMDGRGWVSTSARHHHP